MSGAADTDEKSPADGSLHAIDAQIQSKIGLLESLLGSCDGVLRRHDDGDQATSDEAAKAHRDEDTPAHRSHPGNPVVSIQQTALGASSLPKQAHLEAKHGGALLSAAAQRRYCITAVQYCIDCMYSQTLKVKLCDDLHSALKREQNQKDKTSIVLRDLGGRGSALKRLEGGTCHPLPTPCPTPLASYSR